VFEYVFAGMLVAVAVALAWGAGFVLYKMYEAQR